MSDPLRLHNLRFILVSGLNLFSCLNIAKVLGYNIAHTYIVTFIEAGNQNMILSCMGDEMGLNWVSLVVEMGVNMVQFKD